MSLYKILSMRRICSIIILVMVSILFAEHKLDSIVYVDAISNYGTEPETLSIYFEYNSQGSIKNRTINRKSYNNIWNHYYSPESDTHTIINTDLSTDSMIYTAIYDNNQRITQAYSTMRRTIADSSYWDTTSLYQYSFFEDQISYYKRDDFEKFITFDSINRISEIFVKYSYYEYVSTKYEYPHNTLCIVTEFSNTGDLIDTSNILFDSSGNIISIIPLDYSQGVCGDRIDYTYNSINLITQKLKRSPRFNKGDAPIYWDDSYKDEYIYDNNNNLIEVISYLYSQQFRQWIPTSKIVYNYDVNLLSTNYTASFSPSNTPSSPVIHYIDDDPFDTKRLYRQSLLLSERHYSNSFDTTLNWTLDYSKIGYYSNLATPIQDNEPFLTNTSLNFYNNHLQLSNTAPYKCEIFSCNGRLLKKVFGENDVISLNQLGMATGIYQFRVMQGTEIFTGKFILK